MIGKDLAELVLKEAIKHVCKDNPEEAAKLGEGPSNIQLLEDVAKLTIDATKLVFKDKAGMKETVKLVLKEAIEEAAIVIVKQSVEMIVKTEAERILKELKMDVDHQSASSSKHSIHYWIDKHFKN